MTSQLDHLLIFIVMVESKKPYSEVKTMIRIRQSSCPLLPAPKARVGAHLTKPSTPA